MKKLKCQQLENKRWEIQQWYAPKNEWSRCPGTATFSNLANATAGMRRYRNKIEGDVFVEARHKLMSTNPFCTGIF